MGHTVPQVVGTRLPKHQPSCSLVRGPSFGRRGVGDSCNSWSCVVAMLLPRVHRQRQRPGLTTEGPTDTQSARLQIDRHPAKHSASQTVRQSGRHLFDHPLRDTHVQTDSECSLALCCEYAVSRQAVVQFFPAEIDALDTYVWSMVCDVLQQRTQPSHQYDHTQCPFHDTVGAVAKQAAQPTDFS